MITGTAMVQMTAKSAMAIHRSDSVKLTGIGKRIGAVALASGLAVLSIVTGLAGVAVGQRPALAHQLAPFDARASAALADYQLQMAGGNAPPSSTAALAENAISRDLLSVQAYRVLGLIADTQSKPKQSAGLMHLAGALSRRDLGTRLWLIQEAVGKDDVTGALDQFDLSLRAIPESQAILFPILAQALKDDEYVTPLARVLARDPSWLRPFAVFTINGGIATENIAKVFVQLRNLEAIKNGDLPQLLVNQLIAEKQYDVALRYFEAVSGRRAANALVSDPTLEMTRGLTPFVWLLRQDADIFVDRLDKGVRISSPQNRSGTALSQLLALTPGRYRLSATGHHGSSGSDQLTWVVACTEVPDPPIARLAIPASVKDQTLSVDFSVPVGCRAQWLKLNASPAEGAGPFEATARSVALSVLQP